MESPKEIFLLVATNNWVSQRNNQLLSVVERIMESPMAIFLQVGAANDWFSQCNNKLFSWMNAIETALDIDATIIDNVWEELLALVIGVTVIR